MSPERRYLVTGSAGVIGRETVERLSMVGASVLSMDRLPFPGLIPEGVQHHQGDLAEIDLEMVEAFLPNVIIHLAATFERSIEGREFWAPNWNDNVIVSHRLAEMAGRIKTQAFVFASSYLVYRPSVYQAFEAGAVVRHLKEDDPLDPRNLCGAAKLYAEHEIGFQRLVAGGHFRAVFARIFRVYGRGSRDVISRWIRAGLRRDPIDVYHPENRFDYVYAGDVAEGLLQLAANPEAVGPVNLATGHPRSIDEVLAVLERTLPDRLPTVRVVQNDDPFEASAADVSRLRAILGWQPSTTIEDGIPKLVAHEMNAITGGADG